MKRKVGCARDTQRLPGPSHSLRFGQPLGRFAADRKCYYVDEQLAYARWQSPYIIENPAKSYVAVYGVLRFDRAIRIHATEGLLSEKGGLEELRPSKSLFSGRDQPAMGCARDTQRLPGPSHSLLFRQPLIEAGSITPRNAIPAGVRTMNSTGMEMRLA